MKYILAGCPRRSGTAWDFERRGGGGFRTELLHVGLVMCSRATKGFCTWLLGDLEPCGTLGAAVRAGFGVVAVVFPQIGLCGCWAVCKTVAVWLMSWRKLVLYRGMVHALSFDPRYAARPQDLV